MVSVIMGMRAGAPVSPGTDGGASSGHGPSGAPLVRRAGPAVGHGPTRPDQLVAIMLPISRRHLACPLIPLRVVFSAPLRKGCLVQAKVALDSTSICLDRVISRQYRLDGYVPKISRGHVKPLRRDGRGPTAEDL